MKHNAQWEVRQLTFSPVVTPRSRDRVPDFGDLPLLITENPLSDKDHLLEKRQEDNDEDDLMYSSFSNSFSSSGMNDSFSNSFSSLHSRDSSRKSSSRDSSGKSTRSSGTHSSKKRTRRRGRRRSSVGGSSVAFDPKREAPKSCLKQPSSPQSPSRRRPRPLLGETFYVCLPGNPEVEVKRQSTLRFSEGVHVREVRSSADLCKGEIRPLWWQGDELAAIKENLVRLVRQVNTKGKNKTNGKRYCTRGLERFVDSSYDKGAERLEAEQAVFREQMKQREMGTFDELRTAAVYFRRTRASSSRANSRGVEDAVVALKIINEGKDVSKRRSSLSSSGGEIRPNNSPSSTKKKQSRRSSLGAMMPRRGSLTFRRKPEEQRLKKSESARQVRVTA